MRRFIQGIGTPKKDLKEKIERAGFESMKNHYRNTSFSRLLLPKNNSEKISVDSEKIVDLKPSHYWVNNSAHTSCFLKIIDNVRINLPLGLSVYCGCKKKNRKMIKKNNS